MNITEKVNKRVYTAMFITVIVICFILAIFQQCYKIGYEQIKIWDESFTAKNALEMMSTKSYFIVLNDGQPDHYHTRPPLCLWAIVLSYKLFGVNELASRIPTVIAGGLTMLLLVAFTLYYLKNLHITWIVLLLIASTKGYMHYHVARNADPDAMLALFVTGYFLTYFIITEKEEKSSIWLYVLFSIFMIGAVYTKSVAGLIPLFGIIMYTCITKRGRHVLSKTSIYITAVITFLMIISYYLIRNIYDPGYLVAVFNYELNLVNKPPDYIKHPEFGFYFNYLVDFGFKFFLYLIPIAIIPLFYSRNDVSKRLIGYSLLCAILFILAHSFAVTKNEWYIAPVYPFLWIALSVGLYESFFLLRSTINSSVIKTIVSISLIILFGYTVINQYVNIFNSHRNNMKPGSPVYVFERPGLYFKRIRQEYPEIKTLTCYMTYYSRKLEKGQLQYYILKYSLTSKIDITIKKEIEDNLQHAYVMTCEDKYYSELESGKFNYKVVDSTYYGKLYYVSGLK